MEPTKNRDSRKGNRVARGASRPRVQSFSQSQDVYRPEFVQAPSPQFFVPQQPLPQLPQNFNPFEPRYAQHKRRETESGPLPVRDDSEDDEDYDNVNLVPETQPMNEEVEEEVEEVEVPRQSQRKPAKIWTPDEEEALAKAWIKISVDKQVGDRQTKEGFWKRVLKHFKSLIPRTERTKDQLNSKWTPMNAHITAFNAYYIQAVFFFLHTYIFFLHTYIYNFVHKFIFFTYVYI